MKRRKGIKWTPGANVTVSRQAHRKMKKGALDNNLTLRQLINIVFGLKRDL